MFGFSVRLQIVTVLDFAKPEGCHLVHTLHKWLCNTLFAHLFDDHERKAVISHKERRGS
ncbi:hypothetical protein HanXRQr2_Chr16g0774301 [Helianthus annuus]|uniref:Uncharacterized protein n=1 Tax=Helianthus annuus TaxID=4232 RepID=A0A9K3DX78_HELAN|nr:hypothetical protein HanXRQr2_Chr16g0774301 [Helianthus annuus]KAJ0445214.1 hypothetical protein HanIR_Chr16g0840431 [Helianthus annuus]